MSLAFLSQLGLTPKEAELYELMLRLGESPANRIIKESGLKRASVYKLLYQLKDKKLITHQDLKKKIHFKPASPGILFNLADQQQQRLSQARDNLESVISELNSSYLLSVEKPIVSTFEGISGLKKIYMDTLREKTTIYALLQTGEVNEELLDWLKTDYAKKRPQAGIEAKVIVSTGDWAEQYIKLNLKELRETRLVPAFKYPFQHEINIYGSKIAIIQYKKNEHPLGIIIQHPLIYQTMKAWFDLAWLSADQIK